jgi:hypothetical protein
MARKTAVYAWRVSPALKRSLEETARSERRSVAGLLDEIVTEHLRKAAGRDVSEIERQRELHARAARFVGRIAGQRSDRAEKAREIIRERLRRRIRGG